MIPERNTELIIYISEPQKWGEETGFKKDLINKTYAKIGEEPGGRISVLTREF